jgi:hypothetical protein
MVDTENKSPSPLFPDTESEREDHKRKLELGDVKIQTIGSMV